MHCLKAYLLKYLFEEMRGRRIWGGLSARPVEWCLRDALQIRHPMDGVQTTLQSLPSAQKQL